ncbi:MAG: hypothetical protein CME65_07435 [Halobacteriovoraceae bacterium]|nr:hypothetical protein [Halobacteriovoraceae bacterium]|tara:strand:+ start:9214 stop:10467 length:1254 start_codon:yes stop_codon:yes gene_type:complete
MFNLRKFALAQVAIATIAFAGEGPLEDGTDVCGVPVCQIDVTLEALGELNENQRYNYTNGLVTTYKESTDIKILNNLVASAAEFKALSQEAGDSDWVIREASTLLNNSVFNLAKYSEIDAANLLRLFAQLDNQTKRYEVITYWASTLSEVENLNDLSELVLFAQNAAAISSSAGDEAWVVRAINSLASDITVKLTNLDPAHEGVYSVQIDSAPARQFGFDKIVVLDSTSEENLVVRFINSAYNRVAFEYSSTTLVGNVISGKRISNGSLSSEMSLTFDRATGAVSGTIQTTLAQEITFSGKQTFSASNVFRGEVATELDDNSVIGSMRGSIFGIPGTLSVQSFLPGVYSVNFSADNGFIVLDFVGKFFKKNGVLAVTSQNKVKLLLAQRVVDGQVKWVGNTFSITNGGVTTAEFDSN